MGMDDELYQRLETAHQKIRLLGWEQRESMNIMYKHAQDLWSLLNVELIQCRRTGKITPKYQEIETKLDQQLNTIEQYLVIATLLS